MPDACLWLGSHLLNLRFSSSLTIWALVSCEPFSLFYHSVLFDDALHKLGSLHVSLISFAF